ncbi:RNA polymerase sigma factor [Marinimicrobium sp. ABcell2]|uniref:RNA polymerase sigma factor n=1 Tax=Marinimicrobium sp. ABcell2 TaxID=3069751 RepID=UPI0027ADAE6C|nr:sigma-70 family RNA polymerase sigma factor [Marinimicrobium sp. ABcell2]MDQ2076100.1 sigma-70 family RNA polymerase sigma factor [Marinimicrobium sp. ABcell2]
MSKDNEFETVLAEHRALIYKIASGYSRNSDDLEDLTQEIALQLWRSFDRYDPQYRFSTWIYRIALNVSISYLRKKTTYDRRHTNQDQPLLEQAASAPDCSILYELNQILSRLNKFDRALIMLDMDGLSYAEIAEIMSISPSNVGTKLSRIKRRLADQL